MLIIMRRQTFDLLDDELLGWESIKPAIQVYQKVVSEAGKNDRKAKLEFYRQLNNGQRALFMFYAYHNHAIKSLADFYWWSAYYLAQPEVWAEIKNGMSYFGDGEMANVLEETEKVFRENLKQQSLENFKASHQDLSDQPGLAELIVPLNEAFRKSAPGKLLQVGAYVRRHSSEFLQIED